MTLSWDKLLNDVRRKTLCGGTEEFKPASKRTEFERDYDRILFATPTRRLADKTQVFPMEENDSVRNRLTHSHEVSNLARSIGVQLAFVHADEVFGQDHESLNVKRNIPSILAAAGLAHDLGNPPFGHQGERAIQQWFSNMSTEKEEVPLDFKEFDGNAQTFRLLTQLQVLNDEFGLNLTVATLASLVKYPSIYGTGQKHGFKKHGIFKSESEIINQAWEHTGLDKGVRHPLAYVMEACDDIAYSIIDAEDTVKKGYASFYDLIDHLESYTNRHGDDEIINKVLDYSKDKNAKLRKLDHSSKELNDVSMQFFRVISISEMIQAATKVFVSDIGKIMSGEPDDGYDLIQNSECHHLCKAAKEFDRTFGFGNKEVLQLELEGNTHIKKMLDILWGAIDCDNMADDAFNNFVFHGISENYRSVYRKSERNLYEKCQLASDAVSGMTENYLINKLDHFESLKP